MMLHYEEGNMEIMDYLVQQAKSFLKQIAMWHEPEQLFLKEMAALSCINNRTAAKAKFEQLYQQLDSYTLSVSGNAVNSFILSWIKQKLMN
jgi:hypothetical protein